MKDNKCLAEFKGKEEKRNHLDIEIRNKFAEMFIFKCTVLTHGRDSYSLEKGIYRRKQTSIFFRDKWKDNYNEKHSRKGG